MPKKNRYGPFTHLGSRRVQLHGDAANRFGIGSRITIQAGGKRQVREIHLGSGYLSSPPPEAHFGIGMATKVDRIEIRWPDGTMQRIGSQRGNQYLIVEKGGGCRRLELRVTTLVISPLGSTGGFHPRSVSIWPEGAD